MEDKRQLLMDVMNNKKVDRVPVGLWWHFTSDTDQFRGLEDEDIVNANLEGHRLMYEKLKPDFIKIMSDGFFGHPSVMENDIETVEDIKKIKSIGRVSNWYDKQIQLIKDVLEIYDEKIMTFYNIFSPLNYIRLYLESYKKQPGLFTELFIEDPEAMLRASLEIAKDISELVMRIKKETTVDGIYYSVQALQSEKGTLEFHNNYVKPSDMAVLDVINGLWQNNMLHICGYGNFTNDLSYYKNYDAKVYNWAVNTEKVSLEEGKKLFKDSCVLGGFDNNRDTLLDIGSEEEITDFVKKIIKDSDKKGIIIGADCTIAEDIGYKRYDMLRDIVKECCKE